MAIVATVTPAATIGAPMRIGVTGLVADQVVSFARAVGTTPRERIPGNATADVGGVTEFADWLYPLESSIVYSVLDEAGAVILATAAASNSPGSGGVPIIRDSYLPEALTIAVTIVDVSGRLRPGRVAVFSPTGKKYPTTVGDVRRASEGVLTLYCVSHAHRDATVATLSTGNPCVLRIPPPCRVAVDDMYFTPQDITETRHGFAGACLLDIEFTEVDANALPSFVPIAYVVQSANADAAGMDYADLAAAYAGESYMDMTLSTTGIAP
jgi:hypothetical protein